MENVKVRKKINYTLRKKHMCFDLNNLQTWRLKLLILFDMIQHKHPRVLCRRVELKILI